MIGVKTVIGNYNCCNILTGGLKQGSEIDIMQAITAVDNLFVKFIILLLDSLQSRWMKIHKAVAKVIYSIKIDRPEIPGLVFQNCTHSIIYSRRIGNNLGQPLDPMILFLINLMQARQKKRDETGIKSLRMGAQCRQVAGQTLRMNRTGCHRPGFIERSYRPLIMVTNHNPVNRLNRMRRPPTDDRRF